MLDRRDKYLLLASIAALFASPVVGQTLLTPVWAAVLYVTLAATMLGLLFRTLGRAPRLDEPVDEGVRLHVGPRPPWIHPTAWGQRGDPERYPHGMPRPEEVGPYCEPLAVGQGSARIDAEALEDVAPKGAEGIRETPAILPHDGESIWPICCGRLQVLMCVEPDQEDLRGFPLVAGTWADAVYDGVDDGEEVMAARARFGRDGVHTMAVFACSHCGSVCVSACAGG